MAQVDRNTLIFFVVMFIFLVMPTGTDEPPLTRDRDALVDLQQQLATGRSLLHDSQYNTGYGNITGFHLSYDDAVAGRNVSDWPWRDYADGSWREHQRDSILPNVVSDRIRLFWARDPVPFTDDTSPAYLLNISGDIYGTWSRLDTAHLVPIPLAPSTVILQYYSQYVKDQLDLNPAPDEYAFATTPVLVPGAAKAGNFSLYESGKLRLGIDALDYISPLHLPESQASTVRDAVIVKVLISLSNEAESITHSIDTTGVYFQDVGALVTVSGLAKFLGSAGLSHLTLDADRFATAKLLLEHRLNSSDIERDIGMANLLSEAQQAYGQCEFVAYFQLEKTLFPRGQLRIIDEELAAPQGRPLPHQLPRVVVANFTMYLPDCALVYTSSPTSLAPVAGMMALELRKLAHRLLAWFLCLVGVQFWAFMRQFRRSRAPSLLMSVLKTTLFLLCYQDAMVAFLLLLSLVLTGYMYLVLTSIAATAFIMVGVFELRFIVQVLHAQQSERGLSWWQILRGPRHEMDDPPPTAATTATAATNATGATAATETRATTATTADAPAEPARWGDETYKAVFGIGFTVTVMTVFMIVAASLWPPASRQALVYPWIMVTYLFWFPQFLRNTLKNRRQLLALEFVFTTTIVRAVPILLLLVFPFPYQKDPDVKLAAALVGWLSVQIALLLAQRQFGPRFWVRENWLPHAYDYHQVLNAQDLERAGFALELLARAHIDDGARATGVVVCANTCPICMVDVELPVRVGEHDHTAIDASGYMITPCYHAFHRDCLESWIQYKLQCPVCRERLPPA